MKSRVLMVILVILLVGGMTTKAEECKHENDQKLMWNAEEKAFSLYCWDCNSFIPELYDEELKEEDEKNIMVFLNVIVVCFGIMMAGGSLLASKSSYIQYTDWYSDDDD